MKAAQVVDAVLGLYGANDPTVVAPQWAALTELHQGPGGTGRRADVLLVRAWSGRPAGHERRLMEVKVSRADLTAELAVPGKLASWARYAHRTYFAVPVGLIRDTDQLPAGVGVVEVADDGTAVQTRRAVRRDNPDPLPEGMFVEVFRRAWRAEQRIVTGGGADDPASMVAAATERVRAAERAVHTARVASKRDRDRLRRVLRLVADAYPDAVPCRCGAPLGKLTVRGWPTRHADRSPCPDRWGPAPDLDAFAALVGIPRD